MEYEKSQERPLGGAFLGFDHIKFHVGNAKQAASYYTTKFGFEYVAYQGLETGHREFCTHVIQNGNIKYVFVSPLNPGSLDFYHELERHGDGVKDVAFLVEDARALYEKAVSRGAKSVMEPLEMKDEHGTVIMATIQTYGDTHHSLVQRVDYTGPFLPGFAPHHSKEIFNTIMPIPPLEIVDHCVGNMEENQMEPTTQWYEKMLDFHRFWSVDDSIIHTEYSSLRSIVVTDFDEKVKMPINEPASGKRKSQIQEYVDYYAGAGVQHIAMLTHDILSAVRILKSRGVVFLDIPPTYYENLKKGLASAGITVTEDIEALQKEHILVDYDERGYLLQIFTKPVEDRPTLFFEVIQRHGNNGFGAGNFKSLFEAIEAEQAKRGNL